MPWQSAASGHINGSDTITITDILGGYFEAIQNTLAGLRWNRMCCGRFI